MEVGPAPNSIGYEPAPEDDLHIVRRAEVLSEQTGIPYSEALKQVTGSDPIAETPSSQKPKRTLRPTGNTTRRGLSSHGRLNADDTPQIIRAREVMEASVAAAKLIPQDTELNRLRREFFEEVRISGLGWDEFTGLPENNARAKELGLVAANDGISYPSEEQPVE